MTRVRIGVVGLGEVAQITHLPILQALSDRYEIAALCDISRELLEAMGERYGVGSLYTDFRELARHPDLDAVLVANSDEYHTDCVLAALGAGRHVLVEKPMCLTTREAEEIARARDSSGRSVMVGYMRRFAPAFLEAVERVRELGRINYVRVRDLIGANSLIIEQTSAVLRPGDLPESALRERTERGQRMVREELGEVPPEVARAYRQLCGLGCHDLSAMRELIGFPERVVSATQWNGGRFIAAIFEYDGYCAVFETGVDSQRRFDAHIEVYGETESVRVQYDTPYIRHLPTTLHSFRTEGDSYEEAVARPTFKDPYTCELETFHEVVVGRACPKTTPEDFIEDLRLFGMIVEKLREA